MKYMKLNITVAPQKTSVSTLIFMDAISKQASRVHLYLSSIPSRIKREYPADRFDIYTSWNEDITADVTFLCLPCIIGDARGMVNVNKSFEISFPNEIRCEEFLSKLIEALHFWDARCKRSIRVTEKMETDFPVNLRYGESNIEINGKQMLEFAKYIQP